MFVGPMQVWVHETQAADDVGLFDDLPQHLRAQVAWRQNKDLMGGIHTFRVSHPLPSPCMWLSTLHCKSLSVETIVTPEVQLVVELVDTGRVVGGSGSPGQLCTI